MRCMILFCLLLSIALPACCQLKVTAINDYDFLPRREVIFVDDFQSDVVNKCPVHWRFPNCNMSAIAVNEHHCTIKNEAEGNSFAIDKRDTLLFVEPVISSRYLPDSFTIESDFFLTTLNSALSFTFYVPEVKTNSYLNGFTFGGYNGRADGSIDYSYVYGLNKSIHGFFPNRFDHNKWHHLAISVNKSIVKVYVDQYTVCAIQDYPSDTKDFAWLSMGGIKYRNFKIAGGKKNDELNAIITKNKLVSHAINFDLGKSVIKQESMPFVMELAQVLKINPSIKLEIDGHTDSDGNADINLKLSQSRADEVKKQLGLLGIDTARLTTKGYGATKPLKPDTTPEGKAENRRVEFIKR